MPGELDFVLRNPPGLFHGDPWSQNPKQDQYPAVSRAGSSAEAKNRESIPASER
jgi:hypothetical protein